MFATGNYDGELGLWTSDKEEPSKASLALKPADSLNLPGASLARLSASANSA